MIIVNIDIIYSLKMLNTSEGLAEHYFIILFRFKSPAARINSSSLSATPILCIHQLLITNKNMFFICSLLFQFCLALLSSSFCSYPFYSIFINLRSLIHSTPLLILTGLVNIFYLWLSQGKFLTFLYLICDFFNQILIFCMRFTNNAI